MQPGTKVSFSSMSQTVVSPLTIGIMNQRRLSLTVSGLKLSRILRTRSVSLDHLRFQMRQAKVLESRT
jgi:hypothetical protein